MIRHFYHVFAGGAWAEPVREHVAALAESGFDGHVTIGVVGPARDRRVLRDVSQVEADWIEADTGFEDVTLRALHAWALAAGDGHQVLYAHSKGAYDNSEWNAAWRRSMTRQVVGRWRFCVAQLEGGFDTAGCHWLTPEEFPAMLTAPAEDGGSRTPFYGGNFWWATTAYLRRLPVPVVAGRHDAEVWIGLGQPRAFDLLPGWPSRELCA